MNKILENIKTECTEFLTHANNYPAIKAFNDHGKYLRKVKVRHKKNTIGFIRIVGDALQKEHQNIHIRSVIANGPHGYHEGMQTHYIFPKNGFKFLYNPRINYHEEYKASYMKLLGSNLSDQQALEMIEDSIKYSYISDDTSLENALKSKKEIIFYNMSYYYTVSSEKYFSYDELLDLLKN